MRERYKRVFSFCYFDQTLSVRFVASSYIFDFFSFALCMYVVENGRSVKYDYTSDTRAPTDELFIHNTLYVCICPSSGLLPVIEIQCS